MRSTFAYTMQIKTLKKTSDFFCARSGYAYFEKHFNTKPKQRNFKKGQPNNRTKNFQSSQVSASAEVLHLTLESLIEKRICIGKIRYMLKGIAKIWTWKKKRTCRWMSCIKCNGPLCLCGPDRGLLQRIAFRMGVLLNAFVVGFCYC